MLNDEKKKDSFDCCPHNEGVTCGKHNCGSCGWNPEVAKRRTLQYLYNSEVKKDGS